MKKLRLNVEDLVVESLPTSSAADERGTVRGFAVTDGCTRGGTNCTADDPVCALTWHCSNAPPVC